MSNSLCSAWYDTAVLPTDMWDIVEGYAMLAVDVAIELASADGTGRDDRAAMSDVIRREGLFESSVIATRFIPMAVNVMRLTRMAANVRYIVPNKRTQENLTSLFKDPGIASPIIVIDPCVKAAPGDEFPDDFVIYDEWYITGNYMFLRHPIPRTRRPKRKRSV